MLLQAALTGDHASGSAIAAPQTRYKNVGLTAWVHQYQQLLNQCKQLQGRGKARFQVNQVK